MNCIFLKKKSKIESNLLREYDELKGVCTWDIEEWVKRDKTIHYYKVVDPNPNKTHPPSTLTLGLGNVLCCVFRWVLCQLTRGIETKEDDEYFESLSN
jgi:hypothetical protein